MSLIRLKRTLPRGRHGREVVDGQAACDDIYDIVVIEWSGVPR